MVWQGWSLLSMTVVIIREAATCDIIGSGSGDIECNGCKDKDVRSQDGWSTKVMAAVAASATVVIVILILISVTLLTLAFAWKKHHLRKSPLYLGRCRKLRNLHIHPAETVNTAMGAQARPRGDRIVALGIEEEDEINTGNDSNPSRPKDLRLDSTRYNREGTSFNGYDPPSSDLSRTYTLPNVTVNRKAIVDLTLTSSTPYMSGSYFTPLPPTSEEEDTSLGGDKETFVTPTTVTEEEFTKSEGGYMYLNPLREGKGTPAPPTTVKDYGMTKSEGGYMHLSPLTIEKEHHYETPVRKSKEGEEDGGGPAIPSGVVTKQQLRGGRRKKPPPRMVPITNLPNTKPKTTSPSNQTSGDKTRYNT